MLIGLVLLSDKDVVRGGGAFLDADTGLLTGGGGFLCQKQTLFCIYLNPNYIYIYLCRVNLTFLGGFKIFASFISVPDGKTYHGKSAKEKYIIITNRRLVVLQPLPGYILVLALLSPSFCSALHFIKHGPKSMDG